MAIPSSRPEVAYLEDNKGVNLSGEVFMRCNVLSVPRGCLYNSYLVYHDEGRVPGSAEEGF